MTNHVIESDFFQGSTKYSICRYIADIELRNIAYHYFWAPFWASNSANPVYDGFNFIQTTEICRLIYVKSFLRIGILQGPFYFK